MRSSAKSGRRRWTTCPPATRPGALATQRPGAASRTSPASRLRSAVVHDGDARLDGEHRRRRNVSAPVVRPQQEVHGPSRFAGQNSEYNGVPVRSPRSRKRKRPKREMNTGGPRFSSGSPQARGWLAQRVRLAAGSERRADDLGRAAHDLDVETLQRYPSRRARVNVTTRGPHRHVGAIWLDNARGGRRWRRIVIDERANRDQLRELGRAAQVIRMEVRDQEVIDLLDSGGFRCSHHPARVPAHRSRRSRCPRAATRLMASHDEGGLAALDVDEVDVECLADAARAASSVTTTIPSAMRCIGQPLLQLEEQRPRRAAGDLQRLVGASRQVAHRARA